MKQKPVIFLSGKRLHLRALETEDLDRCRRWVNDPDIRQFILNQMPFDEIGERQWHESRDRGQFRTDITLAMVLKKGSRHIGLTGIHHIDWINRTASTGAIIGEAAYREKGYGSEAKAIVLQYAFDTLDLHRICSTVLATNLRSLAYLKKSGYRQEGVLREHIYRNGERVDEIQLGILAEEWRARRRVDGSLI